MVKVFRQENGSYLIPMELPKDEMARAALLESAKLNGYKMDWVQWGFRKFEAILIPGTEQEFHEYIKEESNNQKRLIREGRCIIGSDAGGAKRCPERIPNPLYGEPGQPKTIYNDCSSCPHNKNGIYGHLVSLSHSGENGDDNEEYDDDIPVNIAGNGELYEQYCKSVLDFVEERFPDNLETMKLLLQEYSRTETADRLGIHRNTPRNQVNSMKDELTEMLDGLFAMYR